MAASNTTNAATSLLRVYHQGYFDAFQNAETPMLTDLAECADEPALGVGWYFPFNLATPGNWKTGAEGGGGGSVSQRVELQGVVNAVEFVGKIALTEMLKNVGTGNGAWGNELNRQMAEATGDISKAMQRLFTISHGTGRLGIVEADTTTSKDFVAANPEGVTNLRENELVDIYDADTSGSAQVDSGRIASVNYNGTRAVSLAATASLTAGWGIYKEDSYGYAPNGLRGLVDDGTYAATIHGQTRATYPALNARVVGSHSNVVALTEDQMRRMCDQLRAVGGEVDIIRCNTGVFNAFMEITDGNRRWAQERGKTSQRVLGHKEDDAVFSYFSGQMPIRVNVNIPAREMYFLSMKKSFRKHTVKKLGWLTQGAGGPLMLSPGSADFNTSWIGMLLAQTNISCSAPRWNGVIRGIRDTSVAGDQA
jgi:hypothetical protein